MVGEEKKANSHTSSSFCLCSPQGCNCFPLSHLSPPSFFFFFSFTASACLPSPGNSLWKNTLQSCFLAVGISYPWYLSLSNISFLLAVCTCAYCTLVQHVLQVDDHVCSLLLCVSVYLICSVCNYIFPFHFLCCWGWRCASLGVCACAYSPSDTFPTTTLSRCLIFTQKKKKCFFCRNSLLASSVKPWHLVWVK